MLYLMYTSVAHDESMTSAALPKMAQRLRGKGVHLGMQGSPLALCGILTNEGDGLSRLLLQVSLMIRRGHTGAAVSCEMARTLHYRLPFPIRSRCCQVNYLLLERAASPRGARARSSAHQREFIGHPFHCCQE